MWKVTSVLQSLWLGKFSLSKAFWIFFVILSIPMFFVATMAGAPFVLLGVPQSAWLAFWLVFLGYQVVATVGVWRSANTSSAVISGWLARLFVSFVLIANVARLFGVHHL